MMKEEMSGAFKDGSGEASMIRKIAAIVSESGADAWQIADVKTTGWEFYFIRHRLDQNRAKEVEQITLTVYKKSEDGTGIGLASAVISPTENEDNIRKLASDLVYRASLVKNKIFALNKPRAFEPLKVPEVPLKDDAEAFLSAMNAIRETPEEDLNSFEIFVNRNTRHLLTSEGIDILEEYPTSTLDVVVNARKDDREIELYRLMHFGNCDAALLKQDIENLMHFGRDRLRAVPTPALGNAAVVLSTDASLSVYEYFLDNLNAAYLVRGVSPFEIGKPLAEEFKGDKVTLRSLRMLPGSPDNFACDAEGAPVRDADLIREGVPAEFVGSRMYAQYLGLEDAFSVTNWSVSGGTRTAEAIRTGEFLEIVEFSDFQVDSMTGDIFGEIRLAYYHDGKGNVQPVTGGSVSGSMLDNIADLAMTEETRCYANARIPAATRLEHVTIAGA